MRATIPIVVTTVISVVIASAAALILTSRTLGAGSASTTCDPDGVAVTQVLSGTNVASVSIGGIAAACGGGEIRVTLRNGTGASSSGSAAVPVAGGTVTVALATQVPVTEAAFTTVLVLGP